MNNFEPLEYCFYNYCSLQLGGYRAEMTSAFSNMMSENQVEVNYVNICR